MYLPADARTHSALGYSPTMRTRVEIWFGDEPVGEVTSERIVGGGVTDTWGTGVRRALDMTVESSAEWLEWLRIGVEIRPYRGVYFGANDDDAEMCPLGRFPVRKFTRPLVKGSPLPIRAQDRWQRIAANSSSAPRKALRGKVVDVAAHLIQEVDPYGTLCRIESRSGSQTPAGVWTQRRHEVIADLLTAISCEAFIDRDGVPVIRRRPGTAAPVHTLRAERGGTIQQVTQEIDWEKAYNAVTIIPTATDTKLTPLWWAISDPYDPAHRSQISGGTRSGGYQEFSYSSPVFTTRDEMLTAAKTLLNKIATPARQYSAAVVPHPGLDASDTVWIEGLDGLELVQIQQVSHPLTSDQLQQITTVSTRAEDPEAA